MNILDKYILKLLLLVSMSQRTFPNRIPNHLLNPRLSYFANLKYDIGPAGNNFFTKNKLEFKLNPESNRRDVEFLVKAIIPSYVLEWVRGQQNQDEFQNQNGSITLPELPVSDLCQNHLQMFVDELALIVKEPVRIFNASTWALQMIDSWGKLPEGILSGHINTYGDWDECVNVKAPKSEFKGKYCWTFLRPTGVGLGSGGNGSLTKDASGSIPELIKNMLQRAAAYTIPSFASCVPSSCSTQEIQALFILMFTDEQNPGTNALFPGIYFCNGIEKPSLSSGVIAMISVLSVMGFLILIGTVLDTILSMRISGTQDLKKKLVIQIILSFSLVTNVMKWQDTKSSGGGFGCIHGIRFLSTCWVLLCHTYYLIVIQLPSWNTVEINKIHKHYWMYPLLNGFFSVDTFFTMSGFLASFSILKTLEKSKGRINIFKLYLHRYLRLTPTYALILGLLATLYPYMGDGPFFSFHADKVAKSCQEYWWHNLLYANNVIKYNATAGESMCENESWYIANDMQFFILAPLFVFLLWKWQYVGMTVLGVASLASILAPGIAVGTEKLEPTMISWKVKVRDEEIYYRPWFRMGPYLVGLWFGYFMFKLGKKPVKLPKLVVIGGWILSTATALALIFGISPYYYPDNDNNDIGAGFYAGLSKFTWGIVICWIIFACVKGYGGVVNSFLSWKVFIPLGRLTFCVYVSSLSVQMLTHFTIRQPMYFDIYTTVNLFFSHVIMCFLVGFLLTMAFESPFIQLEKILLSGGGGARADKPAIEKQNESKSKIIGDSNGNIQPSVNSASRKSQLDGSLYSIPRVGEVKAY